MYNEFLGQTVVEIKRERTQLIFKCADKSIWALYHNQSCCEDVYIEDIDGPLDVLIGSPILLAESVSSKTLPPKEEEESYTWTFVKFGTVKGSVTIRFYGSSNGYYSECPEFSKLTKENGLMDTLLAIACS